MRVIISPAELSVTLQAPKLFLYYVKYSMNLWWHMPFGAFFIICLVNCKDCKVEMRFQSRNQTHASDSPLSISIMCCLVPLGASSEASIKYFSQVSSHQIISVNLWFLNLSRSVSCKLNHILKGLTISPVRKIASMGNNLWLNIYSHAFG